MILDLLKANGIPYRLRGDEAALTCPNEINHHGGKDRRPSFSINLDGRGAHCFACGFSLGHKGVLRWLAGDDLTDVDLQYLHARGLINQMRESNTSLFTQETPAPVFMPPGTPWDTDFRGISAATYQKLGAIHCRQGRYRDRLVMPITLNGKLIGLDARALEGQEPKYLRPRNSTCRSNWLFPLDHWRGAKEMVLGEGLFHAINGVDKNVPVLSYFGVHNWSQDKLLLLLDAGVEHVILAPDPDAAGAESVDRLSESLLPWFKVSVLPTDLYNEGEDLGDLTQTQMDDALARAEEL